MREEHKTNLNSNQEDEFINSLSVHPLDEEFVEDEEPLTKIFEGSDQINTEKGTASLDQKTSLYDLQQYSSPAKEFVSNSKAQLHGEEDNLQTKYSKLQEELSYTHKKLNIMKLKYIDLKDKYRKQCKKNSELEQLLVRK
jgi:hypothetical protein